jgi:hypothetical protein
MLLLRGYSSPSICTSTIKQNNNVLSYAQSLTAVVFLVVQAFNLLLLLLLLAVAFVLWAWEVSFQAGRQLGHLIEKENLDLWQQAYKFFEMAGSPVVRLANWSRQQVERFGIKFPLLPSDPSEKRSDLLHAANSND